MYQPKYAMSKSPLSRAEKKFSTVSTVMESMPSASFQSETMASATVLRESLLTM